MINSALKANSEVIFLAPSAKRCISASGAASHGGVQNYTISNGPKITAIQKENMLLACKVRNFFSLSKLKSTKLV